MPQLAPTALVNARPLQPPRISLLSSAILVDESDDRWDAGFALNPEGCGEAGVSAVCSSDARTAPEGCTDNLEFETFGVWASDKAGGFNFGHRDFQARATRKLLAVESKLIESELWSGGMGLTNPKIQSTAATTISGGPRPPVATLSRLEDALAECSGGIRSMIHVRPGVVVQWLQFGIVRREGDVYLSPMDNIVVPGRGYTGGPPAGGAAGATDWIYTTSLVEVRRGPIQVFPDSVSQATVMARNEITYWAERVVSAAFDPNCCRLAIEMTRANA